MEEKDDVAAARQASGEVDKLVERAAVWLLRAKNSRLNPTGAKRAWTTWNDILDDHERNAWTRYARDMLADLGLFDTLANQTAAEGKERSDP